MAGGRRGGDLDIGLYKDVVAIGSVGEHGSKVEVGWKRRASREDGPPELLGGVGEEG